MRGWSLGVVVSLPVAAWAQVGGLTGGGLAAAEALRQRGSSPPVDIPIGPGATPIPQELPPPVGNPGEPLTVINAARISTRGDVTVWEGRVVLRFRGYQLEADRIEGNRATEVYQLKGHARLDGLQNQERVRAESIVVNFRERNYTFERGQAEITPERTGGVAKAPLYVKGGGGELTERAVANPRTHFHVVDGVLTTCDREHPHFTFEAERTEVTPGDRVVFKNLRIRVLDRTLLSLPSLVIPLIDDRPRYIPEFGQTREEGYYIKSRFTSLLRGQDTWDTRLDYMTRLGFGTGGDLRYRGETSGLFSIYGLFGNQAQTGLARWNHQQGIGSGRLDLDATWQRNNYLTAPETTLTNARFNYALSRGGATTTLSGFRAGTATTAFESVSQSTTFSDVRAWSGGLNTQLGLTYNDSFARSGATSINRSRRVDLNFQARRPVGAFEAEFIVQRAIPAGGDAQFSGLTDRNPLFGLSSDSTRLFGRTAGRKVPFRLATSIGEINEQTAAGAVTRTTFEIGGGARDRISNALGINWDGRFFQGLYSDGTAQYVMQYGSRLDWEFLPRSRASLNYRNLRQFGFTPLAIDRTGRTDAFSVDLDWQAGRGWSARASSGYDVLQGDRGQVPWQVVSLGADYRGATSQFRFAGLYDTFAQVWGTFRADSLFRVGETEFALGVRYDGRRSQWAAASFEMTAFRWGRLSTDVLLNYNGYTRQMEAQQYALVWDMHCSELVLELSDYRAGFRPGRQIGIFFRLKAFPFNGDFGTGRRGQRLGGVGGFGG